MERILALDIGGTFVKYGVADESGKIAQIGQFPIRESGTREEILEDLTRFLDGREEKCVSVSIPGPMSYATGTSHMAHKFVGIKEFSLKEYLENRYPGMRTCFVHDGVAYMLGILYLGETGNAKRPCGVMLGTGLGFAWAREGRVQIRKVDTPADPAWNMPFRDSIAENYISGHAIRDLYSAKTGVRIDVREICDRARAGEEAARAVIGNAGEALGEILGMRQRELGLDRVVLGGQISKSADLLIPYMRKFTDMEITVTGHLDTAALYGAYAFALNGSAGTEVVAE